MSTKVVSTSFKVVEKSNRLAVHACCMSNESALAWIERYGDSGMFIDKTLTKDSFMVIEPVNVA